MRLGKQAAVVATLIVLGLAIFLGANVHLLYVAIESDSECVPHLKDRADRQGEYRAAKSAC